VASSFLLCHALVLSHSPQGITPHSFAPPRGTRGFVPSHVSVSFHSTTPAQKNYSSFPGNEGQRPSSPSQAARYIEGRPLQARKGVGTGSIKRSQVVCIFESYIRSYNSKEVVLLCLYQRLEGVSNRLGRVMPPQASRESQLGSIFVVRRYGRRERDILEAFPGRVMSLV